MSYVKYNRKKIAKANEKDTQRQCKSLSSTFGHIPSTLEAKAFLATTALNRMQEFIYHVHLKLLQSRRLRIPSSSSTSKRQIYEAQTAVDHDVDYYWSSPTNGPRRGSNNPAIAAFEASLLRRYDALMDYLLASDHYRSLRALDTFTSSSSSASSRGPIVQQRFLPVAFGQSALFDIPFRNVSSVPWLDPDGGKAKMTLSDELECFEGYVSLTVDERSIRELIIRKLEEVLCKRFGKLYRMQPFGSFAVGTEIFLSDIDVSILVNDEPSTHHATHSSSSSSSQTFPAVSRNQSGQSGIIDMTAADDRRDSADNNVDDKCEWIIDLTKSSDDGKPTYPIALLTS
jgi:hypothetical protein